MQRPAEIEREEIGDVDQRRDRPQSDAASRSCSQRGLSPLRTPRKKRPTKRGQAWTSAASGSIRTRIALSKLPDTALASIGLRRPMPAAARSRAMPRTPRQSGRFGVTAMSITGSSRPSTRGEGHADGRVLRQIDDAVMLVATSPISRTEQSMPLDSTPRMRACCQERRRCRE